MVPVDLVPDCRPLHRRLKCSVARESWQGCSQSAFPQGPQCCAGPAGCNTADFRCHRLSIPQCESHARADLVVAGQLCRVDDGVAGDIGAHPLPHSLQALFPAAKRTRGFELAINVSNDGTKRVVQAMQARGQQAGASGSYQPGKQCEACDTYT